MAKKQVVAVKAKEIIVEIEDTPGKLAEVLGKLAEAGVNLLAYSALSLQRAGVLHILPDKPAKAMRVLEKAGATRIGTSDIVHAVCPDKIGGGAAIAHKIANAGINIHYSYAASTGGRRYGVVFQTEDNAKTVRVLNR